MGKKEKMEMERKNIITFHKVSALIIPQNRSFLQRYCLQYSSIHLSFV